MSNDAKTDDALRNWKQIARPYVMRAAVALAAALLGALGHWLGVDPKTVERVVTVEKPAPVPPLDEFTPTMGWHRDDEVIARNLDEAQTLHFYRTPAGDAVAGDADVFLWRGVRKVGHFANTAYPNVDQKSVGCCVGCGWKHSADAVQATAILGGQPFEFRPVSVEVIYAGSRVDVGGGKLLGDGSTGAWAAEYLARKGGVVPMQKYASADLSTFSPERARAWGKSGSPADVKAAAKDHAVKSALVKSWTDVKKAVSQGYPIAVCSNQGFTMTRDATGRAKPSGVWSHCMAILGVRSASDGHAEGAFVLNSWGDKAHTGPVWPADAPVAGFWADAAVVDRMVKQSDSFALADVAGFPARRLDWFVEVKPPRFERRLDLFAHFKPEHSLSW